MRVQCEQCGAAYSVADEKIAGRKLKQRCRKCGEPIVIDGTEDAPGAEAAPEAEAFAVSVPADREAVWHIAVGDTTQGPYTLEELALYYADGHIVLDTLICRDGWDDWKQASEVPELVEAARSGGAGYATPAAADASAGYEQVQARSAAVPEHIAHAFAAPVAMGHDPFGDAPVAQSPRVSTQEMGTAGMQRDGTVQFSMDQIRALSAVSMTSVAPVAPPKPGYASHDDSGLIDVRALALAEAEASASAHGSGEHERAYAPVSPSQVSPLQTISPLSLTATQRPAGLDTRTKVLAGLAAFGFVLAGLVSVLALQRGAVPAATVAVAAPPTPGATAVAATAMPAAEPVALEKTKPAADPVRAKSEAKNEGAATAGVDKARAAADDDRGPAAAKSRHEKHESGKVAMRAHAKAGKKAADDAPPRKAARAAAASKDDADAVDSILAKSSSGKAKGKSSRGSSIDDLLEGAISSKKAPPKQEHAEPDSSLPKSPSRDDMLAALGHAKAKASKCKGPGVAMAAIAISGKTGRASSVSVSGVDGAAKSCVEKAVRSTRFPKFQKDTFEVKFPFKL